MNTLKHLAVLLLCWAGFSHSAQAYSINTTKEGRLIRWSVDAVPTRLDPNFVEFLPNQQAYSALVMAFEAWRGLPGVPDLLVAEGAPTPPGHHGDHATNTVHLVKDWAHEPDKLAITVITYEMATGRLLDADILVNANVAYGLLAEPSEPGDKRYDLAAVLSHEAGHMLGLGESEDDPMATMWPYANVGDVHQRTLADDDEEGVIVAYSGAPPPAASGCGQMTVPGRPAGRSLLPMCLLLVAGLLVWRLSKWRAQPAWVGGFALLLFGLPSAPQPAQDGQAAPKLSAQGLTDAHAHDHLLAQRSERMLTQARQVHIGQAQRVRTVNEQGLLFTEYRVTDAQGQTVELKVPGGQQNGIAQRVGGSPPPAEEAEVLVARQPDGSQRWAYHRGGELWGGSLSHH